MPLWSVCNVMINSYDGSMPQDTSSHKMGIFHLNNRYASLIVTSFKANSGIDIYYKVNGEQIEVYTKHDAQYGANIVTLLSDPSNTYHNFSFDLTDASSVDFSTLTKATIIDL